MPSGHAIKPGDVVTAMNGTTIEIDNTDAEGRLVLADCLARAVELGRRAARRRRDADRRDRGRARARPTRASSPTTTRWAGEVEDAGRATGDLVWRMPLHPEYADMIKGQYADIVNTTTHRKAGAITAAQFLEQFVGDTAVGAPRHRGRRRSTPAGRTPPKGGTGFGVRLLVDARAVLILGRVNFDLS